MVNLDSAAPTSRSVAGNHTLRNLTRLKVGLRSEYENEIQNVIPKYGRIARGIRCLAEQELGLSRARILERDAFQARGASGRYT